MNYQIKVTPELRVRLAFAETIDINLSDAPEVRELQASAAEAHAHIQHLHQLIIAADSELSLRNAFKEHRKPLCELFSSVMNWEDSQCL